MHADFSINDSDRTATNADIAVTQKTGGVAQKIPLTIDRSWVPLI